MKRALLLILALGLTIGVVGCNKGSQDDPDEVPASQSAIDYASKGPGPIEIINTEEDFVDFVVGNDLAVVKFGAEWCGPCEMLAPEIELMAGYFADKDVAFAEADVDKLDNLASELEISGIPDVRIFYHGKPFNSVVGYAPAEIASAIASMVADTAETPDADADANADNSAADDDEISFDENLDPLTLPAATNDDDDFPVKAAPGEVTLLVSEEDLDNFVEAHELVVLKAGATWCPPCRKLAPKLPTLAGAFPNAAFADVDVDDSPEIAKRFNINAIPDVIVLVNGEVKDHVLGYAPEQICDMIAKYAGPAVNAEATDDANEANDAESL